ncbi:response regulator transcription factor [Enterovibrio sp. ZSDZ42]|uniref:Response regulator transcription factor n=1 Tax=Enterovibrio gelatinilyticus TaxID=2899819 RepID=A0ABT5R892_9GAMM|nr:response regulator transcription factor [Enterovibrio sp. ZSDZ42]MDD1795971.1 response regulator transcription factor [Enterovibrio sp. ZSDZ42]
MNAQVAQYGHTLLVVEPDKKYGKALVDQLQRKGFLARWCVSSGEALALEEQLATELMMLSSSLPEMKGHCLLKNLRQKTSIPIVLLAEEYCQRTCINSFIYGADDYITRQQPFSEIVCRTAAILRRTAQQPASSHHSLMIVDQLVMDKKQQEVIYDGQIISVTPIQFKLLWTLVAQQHQILSKDYLYQRVLSREFQKYDRSLDMHLSRVRKKLVAAGMNAERLQTAHGIGYCFS